MTDSDFMHVALTEAKSSLDEGIQPVGAVIVSNGKIVAKGRKSTSSFHMGHAELVALFELTRDKIYSREDGLVLYTTIEPCIMCYGAILHCPIVKVVYALEDPWGGATKINATSLPIRHNAKNPEIVSEVLRAESKELMRQFLKVTNSPFWKREDNVFIRLINND